MAQNNLRVFHDPSRDFMDPPKKKKKENSMSEDNRDTTAESPAMIKARERVEGLFSWLQFFALVSIALTGILCFCQEMYKVFTLGEVHLGDLLLMFLYTEIVVMAREAMRSEHEVLIAMPISIAVVALARYMVVSPTHDPNHQMLYAVSILILIVGLVIWYLRNWPHRNKQN